MTQQLLREAATLFRTADGRGAVNSANLVEDCPLDGRVGRNRIASEPEQLGLQRPHLGDELSTRAVGRRARGG